MPIRSTSTRLRRSPPWARRPPDVVIVDDSDPIAEAGCCLLQSGCCLAELTGCVGCVVVLVFLLISSGAAIGAHTLLLHRP